MPIFNEGDRVEVINDPELNGLRGQVAYVVGGGYLFDVSLDNGTYLASFSPQKLKAVPKPKFKVGDLVKVKDSVIAESFRGLIGHISYVDTGGSYPYRLTVTNPPVGESNGGWYVNADEIEPYIWPMSERLPHSWEKPYTAPTKDDEPVNAEPPKHLTLTERHKQLIETDPELMEFINAATFALALEFATYMIAPKVDDEVAVQVWEMSEAYKAKAMARAKAEKDANQ